MMPGGPPSSWEEFFGHRPVPPEAVEWVDKANTPRAPGDPIRHHFIPQSFLRRFADDQDQLAVVQLDDPAATPMKRNVSKVAVVSHLYTTVNEGIGETVATERLLAWIDELAVGPITRLAGPSPFPFTDEDRQHFLLWLGMLWLRDPYTRRKMEATIDLVAKLGLSAQTNQEAADKGEPDPSLGDLDEIEITAHQNQLVASMLRNGLSLAFELWSRFFAVLRFPSSALVLPDRPIWLRPDECSPHLGVGPGSAAEIWIPVDRSTALILHRNAELGDCEMDADALDYAAATFNQQTVWGAQSEVYCNPDDVPALRELNLPSPDRSLLQVDGEWPIGTTDGVNVPPKRRQHRRYRSPD
jgi:hypothetical protein